MKLGNLHRCNVFVLLLSLLAASSIIADLDDQIRRMNDEANSDGLKQLASRINSHDFCAENTDFWMGLEDAKLQPKDSFFVLCSTLDDHWTDCEKIASITNATKLVGFFKFERI